MLWRQRETMLRPKPTFAARIFHPKAEVLDLITRELSSKHQSCYPESGTWLQAPCGGGPAHDGWDGAHHRPHPGVGDAQPLERRVAAGVQEDVEGAQEARQRVDGQRQQGHAGDAAGQGEGDGVEGAGAGRRDPGQKRKV